MIVAPGQSQLISLAPEFITPQDGSEKQDCEVAAAKRWISNYASEFKSQPITLLGDDLYSHQSMAEHCLEFGMNFIFTCLPESHLARNRSHSPPPSNEESRVPAVLEGGGVNDYSRPL